MAVIKNSDRITLTNLTKFIQELVKHEICLVRFNDVCESIKGSETYYVTKSSYPVINNFDASLSILDILYIYKNVYKKIDLESFKNFLEDLVKSRLLIDLPCNNGLLKDVLGVVKREKAILETKLPSDNPFKYFLFFDKVKEAMQGDFLNFIESWSNVCFKTAYGELLKLFRYEVSLPRDFFIKNYNNGVWSPYYVLEASLLPFIEDVSLQPSRKVDELCFNSPNNNMCEALKSALKAKLGKNTSDEAKLTEYQYVMIKRMLEKMLDSKLVFISAPTGSGKTYIFSSYAMSKLMLKKGYTLILYPTKSLAREQLETIVQIVFFLNKIIDEKIHIYILDGHSKTINSLPDKAPFRGGVKVRDLNGQEYEIQYRNKELYLSDGSKIDWISEEKDIRNLKEPAIVISNHSMISYHLQEKDNNYWISRLGEKLHTLIIDEAHYFLTDREKIDFIHFFLLRLFIIMTLDKLYEKSMKEAILDEVRERSFDLIVSSATMESRNLIPDDISLSQIGGINVEKIDKSNFKPINPSKLLEPLLREPFERVFNNEIYVPYYEVVKEVIDRSKKDNTSPPITKRLIVTALFFPTPSNQSRTPFIEAINTSTLWSIALSEKAKKYTNGFKVIAFVDNKESQNEIFRDLVKRGYKQEKFHEDKLLIIDKQKASYDVLERMIQGAANKANGGEIYRYSHLQFFLDSKSIEQYLNDIRNENITSSVIDDVKKVAHGISKAASDYGRHNSSLSNEVLSYNESYYIVKHNADLDEKTRNQIEGILSGSNWNVCVSTSTLELGVNLPNVAVVLQYGAPHSSASFLQRIGRSGRSDQNFRISFSAVFLKNFGRDILFLDEKNAFKSLFHINESTISKDTDDMTLTRYGVLIYEMLKGDRGLLKRVLEPYGNNKDEILEAINKIYNNKRRLLEWSRTHEDEYQEYPIYLLLSQLEDLIYNIIGRFESLKYEQNNSVVRGKPRYDFKDVDKYINSINKSMKDIYSDLEYHRDIYGIIINKLDIIKELENKLDDLVKYVSKQPALKSNKTIRDLIERALRMIRGILNRSVSDFLTSKSSPRDIMYRIDYFVLGNIVPHPAVISSISGKILDIKEVNITGRDTNIEIELKTKGEIKDDNRRYIISKNIPFKYYYY